MKVQCINIFKGVLKFGVLCTVYCEVHKFSELLKKYINKNILCISQNDDLSPKSIVGFALT